MAQVSQAPTLAEQVASPAPAKVKPNVCKEVHTRPAILFIVDQLTELGGGERTLFRLAQGLTEHGFDVSVVTFRDKPSPEVYRLSNAITILPLSSCFSIHALRIAWQLRRYILERRVVLVQTFFESSDIFGALVARLSGVSSIVSSRRDMGFLRSPKHRLAYRAMARLYSKVISVSSQVQACHQRADRLTDKQMVTIHNGTETHSDLKFTDRGEIRRGLQIPLEVPVVITVANINVWKGLDVFVECAAIVHRSHPNAVFVIAGEWTDLTLVHSLQQRARDLGIADKLHLLGRIENVPALLLASDVFVLLSRSEGFPNVVIEAMAAGLPVVATAVGGTTEAVEHNATGFLVESEDSAAAAAHINRLLSDPGLRSQVSALGRRRVEEIFSVEQMVRKHVEVYDALLTRSHK